MKRHYLQTFVLLLLFGGLCVFIYLAQNNTVYRECQVEAGVTVTAKDFLKDESRDIRFVNGESEISTSHPGEYEIFMESSYFTYKSTLCVLDTIPPTAEGMMVNIELGEQCSPEQFVSDIDDVTAVEIAFAKEPDFTKTGSQKVQIILTDEGANETIVESELFVSAVLQEITVEAGSEPPSIDAFVLQGYGEARFITDVNAIDYFTPGDTPVSLRVDGRDYEVVMHIEDSVAPKAVFQDVSGFANVPRNAEQFVVSAEDVTALTYRFATEPDLQKIGEQTVEVEVVDAGGNVVAGKQTLTLEADTEKPVITAVNDIYVIIGNPVSYKKNISYTDNCMEGLECTVDNEGVNLNVAGTYPITYTVKDLAGNETSATVNVIVKPMAYSEDEVNALADAVIARIITPSMTPMEKVQTIFNYVKSHVAYINHSDKEGWVRAAYEGLKEGKGDCYVFACTSKVLLTRAGITNMDIEKIPAKTRHYWNLVDVGDGWYHFDTTPRKDRPTIFMWTDAQMMEYSAAHNLSHNYDHSIYPTVN